MLHFVGWWYVDERLMKNKFCLTGQRGMTNMFRSSSASIFYVKIFAITSNDEKFPKVTYLHWGRFKDITNIKGFYSFCIFIAVISKATAFPWYLNLVAMITRSSWNHNVPIWYTCIYLHHNRYVPWNLHTTLYFLKG